MEKIIHRESERGGGDHGWLKTRHSFSFAHWYEPTRMGFGALRVINDDWIAPLQGFGTHQHKDMEIVTLVMEGTLTHKDSMGNTGVIETGEVQTMSAGTGVAHSEFNEKESPLSLFQIWILPKKLNIEPRYAQQPFPAAHNSIIPLVGPEGTPAYFPSTRMPTYPRPTWIARIHLAMCRMRQRTGYISSSLKGLFRSTAICLSGVTR